MGNDTPARAYLAHFQRDVNSLHPSCAATMASPMVAQDCLASEQITLARTETNNRQEREQVRRDRTTREDRDRAYRNRGDRDRGDRREGGRDRQGHRQARHGRGEARGEERRHHHRDQRPHGNKPRRN